MIYNAQLRKKYKAQAREDIKSAFWPTMGATLLVLVPVALIALIYEMAVERITNVEALGVTYAYLGIYLLAMLLIGVPIQYGAKHYFVARARGEQASPTLVVSCFGDGKKYVTSIKLALYILARCIGWILLLLVVIIGLTVLMVFTIMSSVQNVNDITGGTAAILCAYFILMIAVSVLVSVKMRRFDGAYIRMITTPDANVWQAVKSCAPVFRKHNWELLVFDVSFFWWMLFSVLTLGIASIYMTAYTEIAYVHYFDDLCQSNAPDAPRLS